MKLAIGVLLCVAFSLASIAHASEVSDQTSGPPIDKEALAAIMKHPTEPHYDLLLPMSGRWVSCHSKGAESTAGATQERFSSSDRSHFTRSIIEMKDNECKTALSEERRSYDCAVVSKEALACHLVKTENKMGEGPWVTAAQTEQDLAAAALKLVLKSSGKKKRAAAGSRRLEVRLSPQAGGQAETFRLDFSPANSATKLKRPAQN